VLSLRVDHACWTYTIEENLFGLMDIKMDRTKRMQRTLRIRINNIVSLLEENSERDSKRDLIWFLIGKF
jgi:Golgi nucleoside diphosphatase